MTTSATPNNEIPRRRVPPLSSHDQMRYSGAAPRDPPPADAGDGRTDGDTDGPTGIAELDTGSLETGPLEGGMLDPDGVDMVKSVPRKRHGKLAVIR
jgi:hypothetical protein